jgi:hypothetical protein
VLQFGIELGSEQHDHGRDSYSRHEANHPSEGTVDPEARHVPGEQHLHDEPQHRRNDAARVTHFHSALSWLRP